MSRYKITVRGDGAELRGYLTAPTPKALALAAEAVTPIGLMVASPAEHDYNPFGITEPDNPPTIENSLSLITGLMEGGDAAAFLYRVAELHLAQATVIRGERYRAEQAEAELRDRELHHFETEQENASLKNVRDASMKIIAQLEGIIHRIKQVRSNFPEKCEVHDEDEITCGWKSMIAGIDKVLANA